MKGKKLIVAIVVVVVLVVGVIAGILLVRRSQDIRRKAAPATTLKVSPSTQSKLPGQSVTFTILMDTGENEVTGVDLSLNFDTSAIEITSVIKGSGISIFDQITKDEIDNDAGTVSYSAFTLNATSAVSGAFLEALRITGEVRETATAGTYQMVFFPTSSVTGVDGDNVLLTDTPGSLSVLALAASSTPTASPDPDASPSPTATPTATASATPTATPDALPDAGVSWPTLFGIGVGTLLLIGSLILAL